MPEEEKRIVILDSLAPDKIRVSQSAMFLLPVVILENLANDGKERASD